MEQEKLNNKEGNSFECSLAVPPVRTLRAEQVFEIDGENTVRAVRWWGASSWEGPSTCSAASVTSQICTRIHLVFSQLSKVGNYLVLWRAALGKKKCAILTPL